MSSSFLVPFALHIKPSDECESVHTQVGPLLALLSRDDSAQMRGRADVGAPLCQFPIAPGTTRQLSDLLNPVYTQLPPSNESLNNETQRFIASVRHASAWEEVHVRLMFKEYCQRKSVECEWEADFERLRSSQLHPAAREFLFDLFAEETAARADVAASYKRFVAWVEESTPAWLDGARRLEASKRALAAEISGEALRREALRREAMAMTERELVEAAAAAAAATGQRAQEAEGLGDMVQACARGLADMEAQLRDRLDARAAQRNELLTQVDAEEELLRERIAEREWNKAKAEAGAQRDEQQKREELYEHVRAEEELLRERIAERLRSDAEAEAKAQRDEQQKRDELYEHVRAEEELLRERIAERLRSDAEAEAKAQRDEQQKRDELYEHVRAEEELLRERIAERLRSNAEAEAKAQRDEQQKREELYEHVRAEEELLRERIAERSRRREADDCARREEEISRLQREQELLEQRVRQQHEGRSHWQLYGEQNAPRYPQEQTRAVQYYDPVNAGQEFLPPPRDRQQVLLQTPQYYQPYQHFDARLGFQYIGHEQQQQQQHIYHDYNQ